MVKNIKKVNNKDKIKNKKKIKKRIIFILILVVVALIFSSFTILIYNYINYLNNEQTTVYDMKLQVGDHIAFNVENESLNFGMVMPEGTSERNIKISSDVLVHTTIFFEGDEDLINWVRVSKNDFYFKGKDSIIFTVSVPETAKFGNYAGKAVIFFKKEQTK